VQVWAWKCGVVSKLRKHSPATAGKLSTAFDIRIFVRPYHSVHTTVRGPSNCHADDFSARGMRAVANTKFAVAAATASTACSLVHRKPLTMHGWKALIAKLNTVEDIPSRSRPVRRME
jgi:hypothetical protein